MAVRKSYKLTEIGEIPEEWKIASLGVLANILRGGSPRPIKDYITKSKNGYNWIKIGDVHPNAKYILATKEKIIKEGISRSRVVHNGDLLLSNSMSFGRPYILQIDGCIHDGWLVIQNYQENFATDFLYYLLCSNITFNQYKAKASGSGVLNLNKELVASVLVYYPSKSEQVSISSALSDIDSLISSLERLIAKKRLIKQGAMQELLTGKKRLPGFEGEWNTLSLKDCAFPIREFSTNEDSDLPCIELENLGQNSGKLIGPLVKIKDVNSIKLKFQINDILFAKLRAYLRKFLLAKKSGTCSSEIWVLRAITLNVTPYYLYQIIQTNSFIAAASISYGTHMPRSDWDMVKNFPVYLPPSLKEQSAIASVLSDMDNEIAALEAKLEKTRQIKSGMMEELLTGRIRLV